MKHPTATAVDVNYLAPLIWFLASLSVGVSGASVELKVTPKFSGAPIQPDSLRYETPAGEKFSITRLSYLLSGFALQRADGTWIELTNTVAWMDLEKGRDLVRLGNVPAGNYRGMRFHVGLDGVMNHADGARFSADHPLNPNLNGLHWSWQGGYVFLALEGMWRSPNHPFGGWSFHLARDTNRVAVKLGLNLDVSAHTKVDLDFDLAFVLGGVRALSFGNDGASTHSREGDPLASALVTNLPGSFKVRAVSEASAPEEHVGPAPPGAVPAKITPYRLQMSPAFPIPALPADNPLTEEGVYLGALLFFDPRLSINNSQACSSCHQPNAAFSDPGKAVSVGANGQTGFRNAMPLFNLAWKSWFFWDGRAPSLREQVLQPIENPVEMHETVENVMTKIDRSRVNARHKARALSATRAATGESNRAEVMLTSVDPANDYRDFFARAFGTPDITADRIARALEQFLLTQVSRNSRFDRFVRGETKLSTEEQRGFELFHTEYDPRRGQFGADCFHCHGGPLFSSQGFANNGLDIEFKDPGRSVVTGKTGDKGKFAVPSLRNIAVTAPYMHDGRFATLEQVIEHYSTGVRRSPGLDPNLAKHPDGGVPLTASDKQALLAFLKTLTDEQFRPNPYPISY